LFDWLKLGLFIIQLIGIIETYTNCVLCNLDASRISGIFLARLFDDLGLMAIAIISIVSNSMYV